METAQLKKFAQYARRYLIDQAGVKMNAVLAPDSLARREHPEAVKKLEEQISSKGREQVIEQVAYTWFNRFCALRFMDVNGYTPMGIVSPLEGQFQPEILAEAKTGHLDDEIIEAKTAKHVFSLLNGTISSRDPMQEAYARLFIAACNYYHKKMDDLFEAIDDYTELLIPDDLLSGNSILAYTREALTPDVCQDVEVIGWLYQYYISEKKDEVFEGLKKNKKITPENIPAATQLFTPHWIVRYLVENSLGRLWMLNRPNSRLIDQMDYYIQPEQQESDFLKITSPEEIKICDPACGSGHMLVYAFDLLYAIYEEEGYDTIDIPGKILSNNLFGIEIDPRAGQLASFALTMKAQSKYSRFLRRPIKPQICVLEDIHFTDGELKDYLGLVDHNLFTSNLQTMLKQFEEASNFGSLIRPAMTNVGDAMKYIDSEDTKELLFHRDTRIKVRKAIEMADYLSPKYHVVVANPPYMGGKGMNGRLKVFLDERFNDVKSDLFSAFIIRNTELALPKGQLGFMSPFVWMFISSYEKLRNYIVSQKTITSLIQLEYSGFDGATVPICTFTLENNYKAGFKGGYIKLSDFRGSENQGPRTLEAIRDNNCGWFYRASASDFKKIPGSPIAYWVSDQMRNIFSESVQLDNLAEIRQGLSTCNHDLFLRYWYEVAIQRIGFGMDSFAQAQKSSYKWFPHNKGGGYRKWFGNNEYVVNWLDGGKDIHVYSNLPMDYNGAPVRAKRFYFKEGITYGLISSHGFSARRVYEGHIFDGAGSMIFPVGTSTEELLGFLCSKLVKQFLMILNPTINNNVGDIQKLPINFQNLRRNAVKWKEMIDYTRLDWDSYENSWDFTGLPLLEPQYSRAALIETYKSLRAHWFNTTLEMQRLEEENNRIFIEAYGLQDELTPEVPLSEITLTCNPRYRYDSNKSEEELEALLLVDTMKEFMSYAVGCMFGRYSLDKPGLILANQGETVEDYFSQITSPSFMPDDDNVIPILDADWFTDDITGRFREFLKVTFGDEHFDENLKFIEDAIGKDIRKYFLKDFYTDHLKRYKKRPIYWLFSSPKGSFNALIYMHRYQPDTVSIVLNDYLRDYRAKLNARKEHLEQVAISSGTSAKDVTKALKEIEALKKVITELDDYEREILYPLATRKIEIDLDDGVKVNYLKFGKALKAIPGLEAKEE